METPPIQQENSEKPDDVQKFPFENFAWGTYGVKEYQNFDKDPARNEAVKDILNTFLDLEVQRMGMFQSKESGVSFPYTSINLKELAETFCLKDKTSREVSNSPSKRERIEFIFGSILGTQDAGPFDFCDEAIHKMMMEFPRAIRALKEGREVDDFTIYTLSSPMNELGTMTADFSERIQKDPFDTMGELYAETVQNVLDNRKSDKRLAVNFTGISMGASLAGKTAEKLIERKLLTQSREKNEETGIPNLSITSYEPTGRNESPFRFLQIPLGFGIEARYQLAKNPMLKEVLSKRGKFIESLRKIMQARGFEAHITDEQAEYKKKTTGILGPLVKKLILGVELNESVKSNEIMGVKDPTLYSPSRHREALGKRRGAKTLGSVMTGRPHENRRVFGNIQMSHTIPFYGRKNEMKRWMRAAEALIGLNK